MSRMIINADDFGLNKSRTIAIYDAYKSGLITDTTMVANGDAFDEALEIIKNDGEFAQRVGIHLNLTECKPLTSEMQNNTRFTTNGRFNKYFKSHNPSFTKLSRDEKRIIYNELDAQFSKLIGNGVKISHVDSHHHVHTGLKICPIVFSLCKKYEIKKIRKRKNIKNMSIQRRCFYSIYNWLLKFKGFTCVKYFGDASEYNCIPDNDCEAMVHPDYLGGCYVML